MGRLGGFGLPSGGGGSGGWRGGWIRRGERSKAFGTKTAAERHGAAMETDRERGEYIDPEAGKVRFEQVAGRWLASRVVDPASAIKYESALRLHVSPVFGRRRIRTIKPSEISAWVAGLDARFGSSTARTACLVLHGTLEVAVDDEAIKRNPAKARVVKVPAEKGGKTTAWSDEVVLRIVEGIRRSTGRSPRSVLRAGCGKETCSGWRRRTSISTRWCSGSGDR
ncbi:phage integrase central domain-containing protein [Kribbella sp. NPDC055110]